MARSLIQVINGHSPELRARLRAGGLATAPRHTEAIFNSAVESELRARCAVGRTVTAGAASA